jgi:Tol biopolymer transport system component
MFRGMMTPRFLTAALLLTFASALPAQERPMTFLDAQHMSAPGAPTPSPDGQWLLYTVSTPDWKEARRQSDIHLVSLREGVASSRQLTFTKEKNETSPAWLPDNRTFLFLSNRDAPSSNGNRSQIYLMRHDGGEARRITDAAEGVSNFSLSRDGRWLVYRSGKSGEEQLYRLPVAALAQDSVEPEKLTSQLAGVGTWEWAPDSRRIYFITADTADADEKLRLEKRFTVNVRNAETPLSSLYALDFEPVRVTRLTRDSTITVSGFTISPDSRWVGFRGTSAERYKRNITEQGINTDLYLLEVATNQIERLTENEEVGEGGPEFSRTGVSSRTPRPRT